MAAGVQAGIGNVAAGSLFATLQSIGATGAIIGAMPIVVGVGAVLGLGAWIVSLFWYYL